MRRSQWLVFSLLIACAPAHKAVAPPAAPTEPGAAAASSAAGASASPPSASEPQKCMYSVRRLSAFGRGALRPQIAAASDAFAVAWEETADHRSIRVQTFSSSAQPLGPSIEVADVTRAAAAPRLAANADGDGFAVFWSTTRDDGSSAITMRKIDRAGKPKSDAIPVVVAPGARALDAIATDNGYALAWWNWSGTPHQLAVSFLDKDGRAVGKPLPLTRAPAPEPTVDLARGADAARRQPLALAWDENTGDGEHVIVGDLGRDRLEGRTDLGPGLTPRFGAGVLVWERPSDASIWTAPLAGGALPVRLGDGHLPAAVPHGPHATALCYLRDTNPTDAAHIDELSCGDLVDGKLASLTRLAVEPRGVVGLSIAAAGARIGVAWQSQQEDDTGISFASLSCPAAATARARP